MKNLRLAYGLAFGLLAGLSLSGASACVELDTLVAFSAQHCSAANEETCADPNPWSRFCARCDEDYEWDREYPWPEGMLDEGQSVRPIDPSTVVQSRLTTPDGEGELDFHFIPAHGERPELADITILYSHGRWANIEPYIFRLQMLHELGFSILVWDYRGFGKSSEGTNPELEEWFEDANAMMDETLNWVPNPDKIIPYGFSLGTRVTLEQSIHGQPCAMMLEAPITSVAEAQISHTGLSLGETYLSSGRLDLIERVADYDGPAFFFIGEHDTKFEPEDVQQIVDRHPGVSRFWVAPDAAHDGGYGVPEADLSAYYDEIEAFLADEGSACLE